MKKKVLIKLIGEFNEAELPFAHVTDIESEVDGHAAGLITMIVSIMELHLEFNALIRTAVRVCDMPAESRILDKEFFDEVLSRLQKKQSHVPDPGTNC